MSAITTLVRRLKKVYSTNQTGSSITSPSPTTTIPTTGIIPAIYTVDTGGFLASGGNQYLFYFYAIGANNVTGKAQINGWRKVDNGTLWIPMPLIQVDLIFGASTGVAASDVLDTERFADTITLTSGKNYTAAYEIIIAGTPDDTVAGLAVDVKGAELIQVQVSVGTATSVNALSVEF